MTPNGGEFVLFTGHKLDGAVDRWGGLEAAFLSLAALTWWRGGILLHAGTVRARGGALAICGASGRGKTTLVRRDWARFLNEEHAFLCPDGAGGWTSHWYSQSRCPAEERPSTLPLRGLRLLSERREQTCLRPCTASEAVAGITHAATWLSGMPMQPLLDRVDALCQAHPPMWFDHSLETPTEQVFERLAGEVIP